MALKIVGSSPIIHPIKMRHPNGCLIFYVSASLHGLSALSLKHFCISGVDSSSNPWYHTPNTKTQGRGKSSFIPECREPSAGARRGRKNCILASERLFRTQCQVGQTEPDRYSGRRLPGRCQEAALRQKEWYRKVFTKALSLYHRRQGVFLHKQYRKGKNLW